MSHSDTSAVVKVRFMVHTLGVDGDGKSRNHWSIFLILAGEDSSVRLNMALVRGNDDNGTYNATPHDFTVPNSMVTYFDYDTCSGLQVRHCLYVVRANGRHNYRMTESGNGCRYWVWTIFWDFIYEGYIPISPADDTFGVNIQKRYYKSAGANQIIAIPDIMEYGKFF